MAMLLDTHYHLDFVTAPRVRARLVEELAARGIGIIAQTLTPTSFLEQHSDTSDTAAAGTAVSPFLSLGFHPWWIESEEQVEAELALLPKAVARTRFIGEVGLDFAPRRLEAAPAALQEHVFRRILQEVCTAAESAAESGVGKPGGDGSGTDGLGGVGPGADGHGAGRPYVLSIHTVRSATQALDALEENAVTSKNVAPVFHRFAGTSDELTRLIELGGYISVHPLMLATKRGRAYVRQVPAERLLLESDLPTERVDAGALDGDSGVGSPNCACQREFDDGALSGSARDLGGEAMVARPLADALEASLRTTLDTLSDLRSEDMEPVIAYTQSQFYGATALQ